MKIVKYSLGIILFFTISILTYYVYLGGFKSIKVVEKEIGPYIFVQVERWGSYQDTPKVQDSLMNELKGYGVAPQKAFGIYYDNPNNTTKSPEEFQSVVGLILDSVDYAKIDELSRVGFRIEQFGKTLSTVVHFPKKSNLSILLGIFKAYPALEKFRNEKGYTNVAAIEIYSSKEIIFAMEISSASNE